MSDEAVAREMNRAPALVAHADWSTGSAKRWMAVAQPSGGVYDLSAPEPVGETTSLLSRLQRRAQGGHFVVGFDFPIGVPLAYAERAGITSFLEALPEFGRGQWSEFYDVAETQSDISLWRPFYPRRPGGTSQRHLVDRLGVGSMQDLLRVCERSGSGPIGCSLFWTLGANQVGRAAISGWREVLVPALTQSTLDVNIWPFDGDLVYLHGLHECVLLETYPAEACLHIGVDQPGVGFKKGLQADRQRQGAHMLSWAAARPEVHVSPSLEAAIQDGFSSDANGDDRFDAVVGLMSMIDVITGRRPEGHQGSPARLDVEGWILGRSPYKGKPIDDPDFRRIAAYAWDQSLLTPELQRQVREEYRNADSFEELSGIAREAWWRVRSVLSREEDEARWSEWPPFLSEAGPDNPFKDMKDTSRLTRFRRSWATRLRLYSRRIRKRRS